MLLTPSPWESSARSSAGERAATASVSAGAGLLLTVFTWLCTALGWLLATLTLAGVTGIIQGEQST